MQPVEAKIGVLLDSSNRLDGDRLKPRRKKSHLIRMTTFGDYINNWVYILFTIFIADVLLRFFKVLCEYFKYTNHYLPENRFWTILSYAYCYNTATMVIFLCVTAVIIIRVSFNKHVDIFPPLEYLTYIPVWWLVCLAQLDHSTLDYAMFIRGSHGLDSASSMAANFFHGYLKITLPAYTNHTGIRERIDNYEQVHDVKFATDRLVILVPSKLFIQSKFDSPYLEKAEPLPQVQRNRAGVLRSYKNDVYRFTKPINNRFYYLALEGATPILTFFETLNFQLTSTKQILEMNREILLKFYKYLRKLIYMWPETEAEIDLIFYNDHKSNGEKQDVGEMLFKHFKSLILSKEMSNSNESIQTAAMDNDNMPDE
ncbi:stimulator of interferon genes protein homolog [Anastrepha ludens]|uniref:stimulator of interferon genes protein homolog n=1 Tax=Anastrepha ludens TaxID=28586 RepID=UPI0023AF6534|nr:stimulator of interferon genes protein homolog [Anastrepha ludens]